MTFLSERQLRNSKEVNDVAHKFVGAKVFVEVLIPCFQEIKQVSSRYKPALVFHITSELGHAPELGQAPVFHITSHLNLVMIHELNTFI